MADSTAGLRRQIGSASDLQSVVRAMKAQAASNIGQYQRSVEALGDYARSVEVGLGACLRQGPPAAPPAGASLQPAAIQAVVFGSDQGLVGRFNDIVLDHAHAVLAGRAGKVQFWAVGERIRSAITEGGFVLLGVFPAPGSVQEITALVGNILVQREAHAPRARTGAAAELHLFYNRPTSGASYAPVSQRLLPLDEVWRRTCIATPWPTAMSPKVMGDGTETLRGLIREYLFVSIFRASAESLASENASRLAAMDRADRNIDKMLVGLRDAFHRMRQSSIDEELSDVVAGFQALRQA